MSKDKKIKERVHHSIMVALGARVQEKCPECDSEEYYKNVQYSQSIKEYNDGYEKECSPIAHEWQSWQCSDCEYETD